MLPGPAVPVCCLVSFHFQWAIHPIRPVYLFLHNKKWIFVACAAMEEMWDCVFSLKTENRNDSPESHKRRRTEPNRTANGWLRRVRFGGS